MNGSQTAERVGGSPWGGIEAFGAGFMKFGALGIGLLAVTVLLGLTLFFGLGYYTAVVVAGVDPTVAIQAAATFGRASPDVRDGFNAARFAARRTVQTPAYAAQRIANEGAASATSGLPDFLRTNPQVMGLLESGDSATTRTVASYDKALSRFERQAMADAGDAVFAPGGAAGADGQSDPAPDAAEEGDAGEGAEPVEIARRRLGLDGTAPGVTYAIELGSFLSVERAETFAAALIEAGHAVAIAERVDGAGRTWLHVRLGPYPTYSAAARVRQRLDSQGLAGSVVEEIVEAKNGHRRPAQGSEVLYG